MATTHRSTGVATLRIHGSDVLYSVSSWELTQGRGEAVLPGIVEIEPGTEVVLEQVGGIIPGVVSEASCYCGVDDVEMETIVRFIITLHHSQPQETPFEPPRYVMCRCGLPVPDSVEVSVSPISTDLDGYIKGMFTEAFRSSMDANKGYPRGTRVKGEESPSVPPLIPKSRPSRAITFEDL